MHPGGPSHSSSLAHLDQQTVVRTSLLHEITPAGGASEDLNLDATPRSRTSPSSSSPSPPWPWALPRLGGMQKLEAERAESSEFYARFLLLLKLPGSAMADGCA